MCDIGIQTNENFPNLFYSSTSSLPLVFLNDDELQMDDRDSLSDSIIVFTGNENNGMACEPIKPKKQVNYLI